MKFKLIVFDWDGTLMDSEARIVDSMQSAVADMGLQPHSSEQVKDIIGLGLLEAVQVLLPDAAADIQHQVLARYRHHYLGADGCPTRLFTGADAVVRELAEQDYFLAVATGKGRQGLDQSMRDTGLASLFHTTRCADEAFSKPHPQMLEQIMDELGVSASETLMIGDTEFDMQLAANAGAKALAVDYGVHARDRLLSHDPLGCITDVRDIPAWLSRYAVA